MVATVETVPVSFVLNGQPVECRGDHPHLLAALREELGSLSPKDGCSPSGQCGCCTVLLDGKAQVSCQTTLAKTAGREVTTLEGLPDEERDRYARVFAVDGSVAVRLLHARHRAAGQSADREEGAGLHAAATSPRTSAHTCAVAPAT